MYNQLASQESLDKTVAALQANNITAIVVETADAAKAEVQKLIPQGSEVMTMSSVTLETAGITSLIQESGNYNSVKNQLKTMDRKTQGREMTKIGASPEYALGSVHAVTEDGHLLIASNTGSQLPAYVYGSAKVIWVVGTQKIVPTVDAGMKRLYDYVLPLESDHINKLYNLTTGSFVSKLLIINRELIPGRLTVILVKQPLGF